LKSGPALRRPFSGRKIDLEHWLGYGGSIAREKCFALRIASWMARESTGWPRHMLIWVWNHRMEK